MTHTDTTTPVASSQSTITTYLGGLSALAAQGFASTHAAFEATLQLISEQLGLRTSYLTKITVEQQLSHVLAAYNAPGGCDVAPGATLALPETF